jgi:hypothetical protein
MKQHEITVKFHPDMVRAMFDCGKDRTSRLDLLGDIGNYFNLKHPDTYEQRYWKITAIDVHPLRYVAMHMYKKEGFVSENDFMQFWNKIYPRCSNPDNSVYVHMLAPKG